MKRLAVILMVVFALGFRARAQYNCIPVVSTHENELGFVAGEHATYMLRYKYGVINTDIAQATVDLDTVRIGGVKAFHCKVYGRTSGIYKVLFNISEDFQSWFSCDGIRPLRFYRDTYECGYKSVNKYTYIWDTDQPYIDAEVFNSRMESPRNLQIPLKQCTFDLPSLYYFARNIDLSKIRENVKYPMTFAIDDETYDVYYIYRGKERKKIQGLGTVPCLHFQAKLVAGEVFSGDHDLDIYVSDDLNRVPLYFAAEIASGEASGRLVGCSGLKYPMSWKTKKK